MREVRRKECKNEMNQRKKGWMNEFNKVRMKERMNKRMNKRKNKRKNKRMNKRKNKRMN